MKELWLKLWNLIDGKKTIIFMTAANLLQLAVEEGLLVMVPWLGFTIKVLTFLGGASLGHKYYKYKNKPKK